MTRRHHFHYATRHQHYAALAPLNIGALKAANAKRWAVVKPTWDFSAVAKKLCDAKARYQTVEKETGVPWFFIAVVHEREASQDWNTQLAQGDPLNRKSVHEPRGEGPYKSWEDSAVAALKPMASGNKDWTAGGFLATTEQYNGIGYFERGIPSPYNWAHTDQYHSGKYISDGVFSAHTVDSQPGCAGMLLAMMKIDPSIKFVDSLDAALDDFTNHPPASIIKDA
jgi:lysozyme family protein